MTTTNLFSFSLIIFSLTFLFLTILHTEKFYTSDRDHTENKSLKLNFSWRSKTHSWYQIVARKMNRERMKIGLVHITNDSPDINKIYREEGNIVNIEFEHVSEVVKWTDMFPEWIDESLPLDPSKCPYIPMPKFENYDDLDLVVANVPCGELAIGSRKQLRNSKDVFRLQVNLVVANLLVRSMRKNDDDDQVFVVFVGTCVPMWEIFRCDDMLWHGDNYWIYKPDLTRLKQKVLMPVGSCQLAPPFLEQGLAEEKQKMAKAKEAYVTILHSSEDYVCGAIALAQSIIRSNSTKDLVLLADNSISIKSLKGLKAAGWKIKNIKRIRSPYAEADAYNEWNYSKLQIWQLTQYDKLIFIDSDFIILRNTDEFFTYPQLSASGNSRFLFNSGFMLIEPSKCTFRKLMKERFRVASYNGGDQGFLNEMFVWWHRLPTKLNFLKDFSRFPDFMHDEVIPKDVYALHYLGLKPWMCHQEDYDCNWDVSKFKRFASDAAHRKWWRVHDEMSNELRSHCVLTPEIEESVKFLIESN